MPKIIEEFEAKSASGAVYRLQVVDEGSYDTSSINERSSLQKLPRIQTADGKNATPFGDDTYKIVQTGEIVKRVR